MVFSEYENKRRKYFQLIHAANKNHKKQIELMGELIVYIFDTYKMGLLCREQMAIHITSVILPNIFDLEEDLEIADKVKFLDEKIFEYSGPLELPEDIYSGDMKDGLKILEENIEELRIRLSSQER